VASEVVQSKNVNKMIPQTHHCQQLLLVINGDSTTQKKLILRGPNRPSPALQGVKKPGTYRVKLFKGLYAVQ